VATAACIWAIRSPLKLRFFRAEISMEQISSSRITTTCAQTHAMPPVSMLTEGCPAGL
jgi:hypothetical protein